ncbi:translational activator of cytochrome c oxidase 1 [Corythoichthys intestinalis]|uniref:translational activator of cytochrome c oxidase 1 n=1 Tax=Corythoichthys intestinalis TaxID=161448 RepID=UPI0025A5C141|nr:translational activator of cytochrome c oxidase 1 [Corythoichthys intestinalis]XP_061807131.1 translational activator of cytochrome c oxidase 1-like [Nerophis lumbriciformis]
MAGRVVFRVLRNFAPIEWLRTHPPVRTVHFSPALCAGHNKWSKVKHIKGPKDEARGRMIAKFGLMIKIAVKEGGPNPDMNANLAQLLEQCRNKNIPKASIETAIKNAEKAKPASQHMFEARGPGGCFLLIEVLTDNITRSQQDVRRILSKNGGTFSDGVRYNFSRRGVVAVPGRGVTSERALELAIEAGAEDVQETEDDDEDEAPLLQFICDNADVSKVRASLEDMGMNVTSAGSEFFPTLLTPLEREQLEAASALIEALSDCPDVVRVWDNVQVES